MGKGEQGKEGASAAPCHPEKELHRGTVPEGSCGLSSSTPELMDLSVTGGM